MVTTEGGFAEIGANLICLKALFRPQATFGWQSASELLTGDWPRKEGKEDGAGTATR
jgi:hypothetical protein